jgi:TonB family protein
VTASPPPPTFAKVPPPDPPPREPAPSELSPEPPPACLAIARAVADGHGASRSNADAGTPQPQASPLARWGSALQGYVTALQESHVRALDRAHAGPIAAYVNGMHERIHPLFAEEFLESLDTLPPTDPRNEQQLETEVEIVLTWKGRLKTMGVVRSSGVIAFDLAVLDSIDRAQPFGAPPPAFLSPDCNAYLRWTFHRNEVIACATQGTRPFLLNE